MARRTLTPEDRLAIGAHIPKWLRDVPPTERDAFKRHLAAGLKDVRKILKGFEPDKFNGHDVLRGDITNAQAKKLRAAITEVRTLTTAKRQHKLVRPRSNDMRAALRRHTGLDVSKFKAVPVPVDNAGRTKIRLSRRKVEHVVGKKKITRREPRIRILEQREEAPSFIDKKGRYVPPRPKFRAYNDYFYLPRKARSWNDFERMFTKFAERLPHGKYRIVMEQHGPVWNTIARNLLVPKMQEWHGAYGNMDGKAGMAEVIIGVVRVGDSRRDPRKESEPVPTKYSRALAGLEQVEIKRRAKVAARLKPKRKTTRRGRLTGRR